MGVGDVVTCGDVQRLDLEQGALSLPLEERRPRLPVGIDAAYALVRWRHVEHHDVLGVVREHAAHVAAVHRLGPVLDQRPDLFLVSRHSSALSFLG
nr:hypothetical protein [Actinomadura sp. HBU206391]